jgi:hypothetical protein
MNFPLHVFRLDPATKDKQQETLQLATHTDASANKPVFRAPALPTSHQIYNEVPFTAHFRPRLRERS